MDKSQEIYMINEVALPSFEQGIDEQSTKAICRKCGKCLKDCKCRK